MKSLKRHRSRKARLAKLVLPALFFSTTMVTTSMAQNAIPTGIIWNPSDPFDVSLEGTHEYDLWLNLSGSMATRSREGSLIPIYVPASNVGIIQFPGTGNWNSTIKSQYYNGAAADRGELSKISNGTGGGPYPSGSTIYYGGASPTPNTNGGTLSVSKEALSGVQNVTFQISLGEAYGYTFFDANGNGLDLNDYPVLKVITGTGESIAVAADYAEVIKKSYSGSMEMPPSSGLSEDIYISTFGLQWDLSAFSDVVSFEIAWTAVQHAQLWSFRIDQTTEYLPSFVFDMNTYWEGNGANTNWSTAGNWDRPAGPSATDKVIFNTGSEVVLDGNATVGQVVFENDNDFEIKSVNNSTLTTSLNIETRVGESEAPVDYKISANLAFPAYTTIEVGALTSLELAGNVTGRGLYRRGAGDFILSGDASFSEDLIFSEGISRIQGEVTTTGSSMVTIRNARVILEGDERFGENMSVTLGGTSTRGQRAYLQLGTEATGAVTQTLASLFANNEHYVKDLNPEPQTVPPVQIVGGSSEISTLIVNGGMYAGRLGGDDLYEDNLSVEVGGVLDLQGTSTYVGDTVIRNGGVLRVNREEALSAASNLIINSGGKLSLGSFSYKVEGPGQSEKLVTESYERFERALGTGAGEVQMLGSAAFDASGGNRYVNFGGNGEMVTWGEGGFLGSSGTLSFTSDSGYGLYFENAINLGSANRTIDVGVNSVAVLTGVLSGNGGIIKTGNGFLEVVDNNTYSGATRINGGRLQVTTLGNGGQSSGSLGTSSNSAENLLISNGGLYYNGTEDATTDRLFTIVGAKAEIGNISQTGSVKYTNTGKVAYNYSGATTLELRGTNGGNNEFALEIGNNGSFLTNLTKGGIGSSTSGADSSIWRLTNENNSYTGYTMVNAGRLEVTKMANGGVKSSIGSTASAVGGIRLFRAGLRYVGTGDSTDRIVAASGRLNGTGELPMAARIESSGTGALKFTNTTAMGYVSTASGTVTAIGTNSFIFTLGGTNTGDNLFANAIGGGSAGRITKEGSGRWILSGTNSYTSVTDIQEGTLAVYNLQNGGVNSNIGASTNAAANLVINNGTLEYIGTGSSTNRLMTIGKDGGRIDSSGSGAVSFTATGALAQSTTGSRTFTLGGSNTGNNTFALAIGNASGGVTSLEKAGEGKWILSGNNTFSGGTLITGGELVAGSSTALGTGAAVLDGGKLSIAAGISISNEVIYRSGSIDRAVTSGSKYTLGTAGAGEVSSDIQGGVNTTASLVASQNASGTRTLVYGFHASSSALNDELRVSDIFSLEGTGSDIFVLQLAFDSLEGNSTLSWFNEATDTWVNAVEGNTGAGSLAGRYEMSWAEFSSLNASASYGDMLGAWGVDLTNGAVWSVLNHNSEFTVTVDAIPEPGTWALMLGGAGLLYGAARKRRRAVA